MRHRKAARRLSRTTSHRQAMMRNLVTSFLDGERVVTTDAKAKELRPLAEKMISLGKRGDLHARRQALAVIRRREVVEKVFSDLKDRYQDRSGGYLRITKIGQRRGDASPVSVVELLPAGATKAARKKSAKPKAKPKPKPKAKTKAAKTAAAAEPAPAEVEAAPAESPAEAVEKAPEKKAPAKKKPAAKKKDEGEPKKKPAAKKATAKKKEGEGEAAPKKKPAAKKKDEGAEAKKPAARKSAPKKKPKDE